MLLYFLAFILNRGRCYLCNKYEDVICQKCLEKFETYNKEEFLNNSRINSIYYYNQIASKVLISSKYPPYNFYILYFLISKVQYFNFPKNTIFCPVPLSSQKMFDRKFNQAEVIAQYFAKKDKIPVFNLLRRVRDSKPLFSLSKKLREEELKKIFKPSLLGLLFPNKTRYNIFLVDDVVTTGQTLSQCLLELKLIGFKNIEILTMFRAR